MKRQTRRPNASAVMLDFWTPALVTVAVAAPVVVAVPVEVACAAALVVVAELGAGNSALAIKMEFVTSNKVTVRKSTTLTPM
jgi:hypothetical protein